jgi:hypothetical protein
MDKEQLAAMLAGATYDNFVRSDAFIKQIESETNKSIEVEAKQTGLVIVFGASDDLMEFRGAVDDELGAYNGTTAYLTSAGLLNNDCEDEVCQHFLKLQEGAKTIEACWNAEGYSWIFKTDIPHATFEITEDGGKYCRGIVFALADA